VVRAGRKPEVKRRIRLRRHGDFQAVMSGKRFFSGKTLVGFAIPNQQEANRVGVTVSRTLKSAVDRNRARRRLRELVRITLLGADSPLTGVGIRYDVVLIARPAALEVAFAELVAEAEQAALRLSKLKS
jgi:ribonuclease P protein component